MWKFNLSRPTFLILFLAVGFMVGVSFSSVYAGIPWDTADIADDAITTEKIKNKTIKNADIRNNQIKSGKIRDGTILFADINQNDCATNEIMKWDGASWVCAIENIKTYTVTKNVTPLSGGGFANASLQCNTGDFMTGWFWDNLGMTALAKDLRYITMNNILDANENLIGGQIVIQNTGVLDGSIRLAIICLSK